MHISTHNKKSIFFNINGYISLHKGLLNTTLEADMESYIQRDTATIFFYRTFI